jgi:hypothetical protein
MALQVERKRENKVYLSTMIDSELKKAIDEVRGILSKSQYVQLAVEERLEKDRRPKQKS